MYETHWAQSLASVRTQQRSCLTRPTAWHYQYFDAGILLPLPPPHGWYICSPKSSYPSYSSIFNHFQKNMYYLCERQVGGGWVRREGCSICDFTPISTKGWVVCSSVHNSEDGRSPRYPSIDKYIKCGMYTYMLWNTTQPLKKRLKSCILQQNGCNQKPLFFVK